MEKKERVVDKILKELTPERIKKEIQAIQQVQLPPELQKWIREYEEVGTRDAFLWKWTYLGMQKTTLSGVLEEYKKSLWVTKTISIILNTLMDDIADKEKNKELLETALDVCLVNKNIQINFSKLTKKDKDYLDLIKNLWEFLNKTIKNYPRYKEFGEFFLYDYQQFFNTMRYSYLINENPDSINLTECEIYSPHNIQGIIALSIDLMCSPQFDSKELGSLREIGWRAQRMGRVGNSITTWEREAYENDFSSEVFAYSIKKDIIGVEDLKKENKEKLIQKIKNSNPDNYFLEKWTEQYNEINIISKKIKSINVGKLLSGLENLIIMHLVSRGLK